MRLPDSGIAVHEVNRIFELWRRGDGIRRSVSGESFHEREIMTLLPPLREEPIVVQHQALLIPEPANRYDPNAVRVVIRGQHVGYLTREDAPLYQPMIARLLAHGYQPTAPARIWARQEQQFSGTDRRGRDIYETRVMASVTLGLDEPHLCVPANLAPASAHALLPFGSAIQVKAGRSIRKSSFDTCTRRVSSGHTQFSVASRSRPPEHQDRSLRYYLTAMSLAS